MKQQRKVYNKFKVNNKDSRMTSVMSFLYFVVHFEHILHFFVLFLLLKLSINFPVHFIVAETNFGFKSATATFDFVKGFCRYVTKTVIHFHYWPRSTPNHPRSPIPYIRTLWMPHIDHVATECQLDLHFNLFSP